MSRHVFCVDDDPDDRERTAESIERRMADVTVHTASRPPDGTDWLDSRPYDCIVSRYAVPDVDGLAFLEQVREEHLEVPFVLFTDAGSEAIASRAISAGATDYVRKTGPDQYDRLAKRVDEAIAAHVRDATERNRRERDLETLREAIEQAGHSIYVTDSDGEIIYVNPAFERLTGYSADEAVGRTPTILKSGEHGETFYRELWETILDGDVWEREIVNENASGEQYVANQTIAPITDEAGEIVRFVAINADVTDRNRHERQLRTLYESTTAWLEASSRERVCDLAGTRIAELPGFDVHAIYLVDGADGSLEPTTPTDAAGTGEGLPSFERDDGIVGEALESGEPRYLGDVHADVDVGDAVPDVRRGVVLPLGDHGVLLLGATETEGFTETETTLANVFASTLTAVLTRIERERDLEVQNSRLKEFAHVVSHDLRNPLSVARGHLDLAIESGDEAPLHEVDHSHARMERIIDDLLWLAEEGREIGETKPVDLEGVADAAWAHVDTPEATIAISCDRRIEADPDRLQQLFENLYRNAVEHGGADVSVRVGSLEDGFYVADDGPGIPPAERGRVFESGYSTSPDGTGYGLSVVRTIVDAHGWDLEITASSAGGARFEVRGVDTVRCTGDRGPKRLHDGSRSSRN